VGTGVGLVFPRADRSIAVEFPGYPVVRLRPIEGLEFVEEAVIALGSSTELATHPFRECWAVGTGSEVDLCRAFGWPSMRPEILTVPLPLTRGADPVLPRDHGGGAHVPAGGPADRGLAGTSRRAFVRRARLRLCTMIRGGQKRGTPPSTSQGGVENR
jgi:hypothetical protein